MNVLLPSELEKFVSEKIEIGLFDSANEGILEGLKLLKERDEAPALRLEGLRRAIQIGIDQADEGRVSTFDESTLEGVKSKERRRDGPAGWRSESMKEPLLTDEAMGDLDDVRWFIAGRRDEATADRIASNILAKCRAHARFPETGRSRAELAAGLLSFPISPYVVFYRPIEGTIQVLRILHGSRDTDSIMRSDPADRRQDPIRPWNAGSAGMAREEEKPSRNVGAKSKEDEGIVVLCFKVLMMPRSSVPGCS